MNWIPYYIVCSLAWFIVWGVGFWYYQARRQHGPLWNRLSWPLRTSLVLLLASIPVAYVFSHVGYQRLLASFPEQHSWLAPMADLYVPLQFLTLLKNGTLDWSFEPLLYPVALIAALLVPFVIHRFVLAMRFRNPRVLGIVAVGLFAVACFVFMLGPA